MDGAITHKNFTNTHQAVINTHKDVDYTQVALTNTQMFFSQSKNKTYQIGMNSDKKFKNNLSS